MMNDCLDALANIRDIQKHKKNLNDYKPLFGIVAKEEKMCRMAIGWQ